MYRIHREPNDTLFTWWSICVRHVKYLDGLFFLFSLSFYLYRAIIDHCGGFCAWTVLPDKNYLVNTADMRIDYIRPAPVENLFCDAKVIHAGERLIRTDVELWNSSRTKLLAIGRQTMNIYLASKSAHQP